MSDRASPPPYTWVPSGATEPVPMPPDLLRLVLDDTRDTARCWMIPFLDQVTAAPGLRGWVNRWCLRRLARYGLVFTESSTGTSTGSYAVGVVIDPDLRRLTGTAD